MTGVPFLLWCCRFGVTTAVARQAWLRFFNWLGQRYPTSRR